MSSGINRSMQFLASEVGEAVLEGVRTALSRRGLSSAPNEFSPILREAVRVHLVTRLVGTSFLSDQEIADRVYLESFDVGAKAVESFLGVES